MLLEEFSKSITSLGEDGEEKDKKEKGRLEKRNNKIKKGREKRRVKGVGRGTKKGEVGGDRGEVISLTQA